MTAITITVKVSEELAHKLETMPDRDEFVSVALTEKIKSDHAKMLEEEYGIYETDEPVPDDFWKDIEEGLAQVARGEYMPADEYFAQRREERKKRDGVLT
jgi:predicted transcriptional regulator